MFHTGKSEYEDVLQCNNAASSATPRGHQSPAAFLIKASGLENVSHRFEISASLKGFVMLGLYIISCFYTGRSDTCKIPHCLASGLEIVFHISVSVKHA